ncbi:MAG: hypothetical protein ACI376_01870 [Candidatus Bruticola sp.]
MENHRYRSSFHANTGPDHEEVADSYTHEVESSEPHQEGASVPLSFVNNSPRNQILSVIFKFCSRIYKKILRSLPGNIDGQLPGRFKLLYSLSFFILFLGFIAYPLVFPYIDDDVSLYCTLGSSMSFFISFIILISPSYDPPEEYIEDDYETAIESSFSEEESEPLTIEYSYSHFQYLIYTLIAAAMAAIGYYLMICIYIYMQKYYLNDALNVSTSIHVIVAIFIVVASFLTFGNYYQETAVITLTNEGIKGKIKGLFSLKDIKESFYASLGLGSVHVDRDELPSDLLEMIPSLPVQDELDWEYFKAFSVHHECIVLWSKPPEENFMSLLYITVGASLELNPSMRLFIPQNDLQKVTNFLSHKLKQVKFYPNASLIYRM